MVTKLLGSSSLSYRSGFLPRILGVLLMVPCFGDLANRLVGLRPGLFPGLSGS